MVDIFCQNGFKTRIVLRIMVMFPISVDWREMKGKEMFYLMTHSTFYLRLYGVGHNYG